MDSIHKRGVVKEISNTLVIGLASVLIAIPAMANSEKESAQCRVVGQKAFKVMLSYQSSEMVSIEEDKVDSISNVDWDKDMLASGLWLLANQVNIADGIDKKFAVSEKFEALVVEKCLAKQLGPLQPYVAEIEPAKLVLDEESVSEETKELLPMLKLVIQKLDKLEGENEKLKAMVRVMKGEIVSNDSENQSSLTYHETEALLADIEILDRKVRLIDAIERTTSELDERLLFAEQDIDAITSFRQETNRKLNMLQEQIRTLQYSE